MNWFRRAREKYSIQDTEVKVAFGIFGFIALLLIIGWGALWVLVPVAGLVVTIIVIIMVLGAAFSVACVILEDSDIK